MSGKYSVFRNDDVSVTTDIGLLLRTHETIVASGKVHTVAVEMDRLWENKEVWFFLMTARSLNVGLHGWTHAEYWKMSRAACIVDIERSLSYWNEMATRGQYNPPKITTFYPPWNKVGPGLTEACAATGLSLDSRTGPPVYGFHSWEFIDRNRLNRIEQALRA